jgi:hypothetical protein
VLKRTIIHLFEHLKFVWIFSMNVVSFRLHYIVTEVEPSSRLDRISRPSSCKQNVNRRRHKTQGGGAAWSAYQGDKTGCSYCITWSTCMNCSYPLYRKRAPLSCNWGISSIESLPLNFFLAYIAKYDKLLQKEDLLYQNNFNWTIQSNWLK